jgi:hypothetical protein
MYPGLPRVLRITQGAIESRRSLFLLKPKGLPDRRPVTLAALGRHTQRRG